MEKKQQPVGILPKDAPAAVKRNKNTDENIERVYEEQDVPENPLEIPVDDDAEEESRKRDKAGTDF